MHFIQFFKLFIGFSLLLFGISAENVIIDTDAGGDDAVAILLTLAAEASGNFGNLKVIGITCTYGNTEEENVETNVRKTLTIADRGDIPIYGGAKKPILFNFTTDIHFGSDGFGDFEFDRPITSEVNRSMHAALAMVQMAKENAGNVSVLVLGPLTNVGLALSLDPDFQKHVNKFYVMGSSVSGIGNVRPNVEFNFAADPESNFIVLQAVSQSQCVLLPWETALNPDITREWRVSILGKVNSEYVKFLNKAEAGGLGKMHPLWRPADALAAAVMLNPTLATQTLVTKVEAVVDGKARGSVLVDYLNNNTVANTEIVQSVDASMFKKMLMKLLS